MGISFVFQDGASAPARQAQDSINGLSGAVDRAATNIQGAAQKIQSGFIATLATVTALLGPFIAALGASTEFNFQIARAGAIGQATAEEIVKLKEAAFDLGNTTIYNATEIAQAEVTLAQAGFAVNQQLEMLPALTNLATAGVVSLDYAAGIASDTMFQFGLKVSDMERIGDVIVNAANMSNMSVENFGNAMKYLGPTAKAFNISLEEAAGYIEMMANSGMRGSVGTRAFGTSLVNLSHPTKQAADLMSQLNFSSYDAQGKFVGLSEMVRRFQRSITGLTPQQRDMAISTIFGNEAIQEMTQLMNLEFETMENGTKVVYKGADALDYFTKKNNEAKGVSAAVSAGIMDNLKMDLKLLSSAWQTLLIKVGDIQEGPLRGVAQTFRDMVQGIQSIVSTKFGQWLVGISAGVALVASSLVVLGFVTSILIPQMWAMVTAGAALAIELLPVIAAVAAVAGSIIFIKESIDEFNDVLSGKTSPLTGFIGLMQKIGGVAMAAFEIFTSWNGETFTLSQNMYTALQRIGILDFVMKLSTWIVRFKEFIVEFVHGLYSIYTVAREMFSVVGESFDNLAQVLSDLNIPFSDTIGNLGTVRGLATTAAGAIYVLTTPFRVLAFLLSTIADTMSFIITNFKEVTRMVDLNAWAAGLSVAAGTGDWSYVPGANIKNTYQRTGEMFRNATPFSVANTFGKAMDENRSETALLMGMRGEYWGAGQEQQKTTTDDRPIYLNVLLDGDLLHSQVVKRQQMADARQ